MGTDLLRELLQATLASTAALLVLLAIRQPLRRFAGAGVAYTAWAVLPMAIVAVWLPAMRGEPTVRVGLVGPIGADLTITASADRLAMGLCIVWFVGAVATAMLFAIRHRRFLQTLRPDSIGPHATSDLAGPAVIGVLRPRIVLPAAFAQRYTPDEQALVLAHEHLHVARGDLVAQALASALRCLFWFNPLLPFAERRFRDDQEMACDAAVLRRHPESRRNYGSAMLKTHLADVGLPLGCHWRSGHSLKERITMLTHPAPHPIRRRAATVAVAATLFAAATLAWAAQPVRPGEAASATAPPVEPRPLLQLITDDDVLTPPRYPARAAADGVSGVVVLDVLVGADGRPDEVRVFSSQPEGVFDRAAVEAAVQWQFNAGRNARGEKVEGWVRVPMHFSPKPPPEA